MSRDPVLASYVYKLAELPPQPSVILETPEQQVLLNLNRTNWEAMSLWLRHLLLGEALAEEAYLTSMINHQPRAELMAAEFRLAVGVHPRSAHPTIRKFSSPAELWFHCQLVLSYGLLESKGLLGQPEITGKSQRLKATRRFINLLEDLRFTDWEEERARGSNLIAILVLEAQDIAKVDTYFAFNYYKPFIRQFKRVVNFEKNNKELQNTYLLPDGQLYHTQKGGSLPKSNVKKNK